MYQGRSCKFAIFNEQFSGKIYLIVSGCKPESKSSFLRQYLEIIGRFGPLIKILRFEARHGYFKSLFNINKHWKNLCQPMAKRHQFVMFLYYAQDNLLDRKKPHRFGIKMFQQFFKRPIEAVVREIFCLHDADLITKGYAVGLNGQRYNTGEGLLLGFDGDQYLFGIIENIIVDKAKLYSLGEKMETVSYHFYFNAYEVTRTTTYLILQTKKKQLVGIRWAHAKLIICSLFN